MMETLVATTKVEGKTDSAAQAAGELLRMRQSQATEAGSDVGTVVSKAKRAASSLWLLLHAQVSTLGNCVVPECLMLSTGVACVLCPCSHATNAVVILRGFARTTDLWACW